MQLSAYPSALHNVGLHSSAPCTSGNDCHDSVFHSYTTNGGSPTEDAPVHCVAPLSCSPTHSHV